MNKKLTVYLAGGMRSNWQNRIVTDVSLIKYFNFVNPMNNRLYGEMSFAEFTFWDMLGVDQSDIVFLYLEKDNPAGHASMVEAGYKLGQGGRVIFVNEQIDNKYTTFLSGCQNVITYTNLQDGIEYLYRLSRLITQGY